MALLLDILSWLFLVAGGAAVMVGMTDTLGAGAILIGLTFQAGFTLVTVKLVLMALFIFLTSPTATHALAKSALHGNLEPLTKRDGGASST